MFFIKESKIIKPTFENYKDYFIQSTSTLSCSHPTIAWDTLVQLIKDRYKYFDVEMTLFVKQQNSVHQHYPAYFFSRVLSYPLEFNQFDPLEYKHEYWSNEELSGLFAHQFHNLKNKFFEIIKPIEGL